MRFEPFETGLQVFLEKTIYKIETIHKCFYWYGAKYDVDIADIREDVFIVSLSSKNNPIAIDELISRIRRDIIDFQLRDIVNQETKIIKELLLAKAFANYDTDTDPESSISDPIGFDPSKM